MEKNNKQPGADSDTKVIAQIVGYLKNYPFLLMAVFLMLIMFAFLGGADNDKIRELKPLIYGLLSLAAVLCGLQFFFEFRKLSGRREPVIANTVKKIDGEIIIPAKPVHFSRKAIASLVLIAINMLAFGGALDKDAHLGAVVVFGIPALLLGYSALNDTLHGVTKGRGWAIAAAALSVLMILLPLGGMSQNEVSIPANNQPVNTAIESQPDVSPNPPPVPDKQVNMPRSISAPQQAIASECVTQYGTCPMMIALPVGVSCTCTGQYGVFPGLAQ